MTASALHRAPWAGLVSGPLAWALSFQGNYLLVEYQCGRHIPPVPFVAVVLAALALAGGAISWRALPAKTNDPTQDLRIKTFLSALGILAAIIFTLGILLQGAAGVVFNGCER
jgi:hypothetical protein